MTREEKAYSLGQEYFPSANNIWARPNFEAQWVSEACMKMAEWERNRLIVLSEIGIMDSSTDNIYDKVIHYIEFLIKCGDFNREYLEEL